MDIKDKHIVIEAMETDAKTLSGCSLLCTPIGTALAYKYQLRGSIIEAVHQLHNLTETYKVMPDEAFLKEVEEMDKRVIAHRRALNSDPYIKAIDEAWASGDRRKYDVMYLRRQNRMRTLHANKECICFLP